jgi:uncharacterized membrane protein HdeD (DUF308 family)
MNPILRNILGVLAGIIVGSIVNMSIITLSPYIIAPPDGVDVLTPEGLKAGIHLFEPKHFIMPFLAHAIGTLVGAFLAFTIASNRKLIFAYVIGGLFFVGGVMNVFMLPAPIWFSALDLIAAYLPMAYVATKLGKKES